MAALSIKSKIPNIITISRIILIIPIIVLMLVPSLGNLYSIPIDNMSIDISINSFVVFVLFLIASISDWADGFISRKYNWVSDIGKILDPIADKVLINSIFILFIVSKQTYVLFPILFIFRDTVVDAMRMVAVSKKISIAANFAGKLKTILQMIAVIVILLFGSTESSVPIWYYWGVQQLFVYFALIASLTSGGIYIFKFSKLLRENKSI